MKNCLSYFSTLKMGIQLIERLREVHNLGYIHRDMKPENICLGLDQNAGEFYLIDFGLSKPYKEPNGQHIPMKEKSVHLSNKGTGRYGPLHEPELPSLGRAKSARRFGVPCLHPRLRDERQAAVARTALLRR
jgi:serine/threonine protein kinase